MSMTGVFSAKRSPRSCRLFMRKVSRLSFSGQIVAFLLLCKAAVFNIHKSFQFLCSNQNGIKTALEGKMAQKVKGRITHMLAEVKGIS